ncbi:MAG: ATP-binding protein, partial [Candidatus Methanoperedens sp.]
MFIQHLWNYRLVHAIRFSDDRFDRKEHYGKNPEELNAIIRESMQTHMAESCIKAGVVAHKDDFIVQVDGNTVTGKGTIEHTGESLPNLGEGFTISSISIESGKSSSFDPFDVSPQKIELIEITCTLSIERVLKYPRKIHTLVIEEAHNVAYERYDETDNSPSLVEQILSEIRKFGEGVWIVDQLPEMLEERVLKLANNLIVHKTDEDHAVAKMSAQLGILEEPPMYEFLRVLSPGMALLKLNSSQATYPIEVCYPEMERPELSERELIESGNRLKEICIEEEKTSSRVIFDAVPDVKQVFDSEDMKKRGFKHILSFGTGIEPGISNQKLAILSIMAYNECYAEPLTKEKLFEQYREMWKRDLDETHINEIMEMGLLLGNESMPENGNIRMVYVLTDRGKQFIASSVHLFQVPLYHFYKQNLYEENSSGKENEKEKEEEKEKEPEETENIFSDLISPAVSKNNRELALALTNRPPFAFIVSGIKTVGVLSKQESIGMAVDMLRKKSIDEVIMINERDPDLKELR